MEKFSLILERKLLPVAGWVSEQKHLRAVRDGGLAILPLLLVGSLFLITANPPLEQLAGLTRPYAGEFRAVINATFGIMGLLSAFVIPWSLAGAYGLDAVAAGVVSVSAFFAVLPGGGEGGVPFSHLGGRGFFLAMIVGFYTVAVIKFFVRRQLVIRLPDNVPPAVARSFAALIPAFCVLGGVWLVNRLLHGQGHTVPSMVEQLITVPLLSLGSSFASVLVAEFIMQFLWSFGIHGEMLVMGVMGPIWNVFSQENALAKMAGLPLPHVITTQFTEVFVLTGGSGMTLPLAVLLLWRARSTHLKLIGRTAIWPGIFNINEPIIFGLPIILNPVMIIPFIICPLAASCTTYLAMASGLVSPTYADAPGMPVFLNGFFATGDWRAVVLQLVNFVMCGLIYYPFFRTVDGQRLREEAVGGGEPG
ncbi:MAG: PTS sugar transporter subunit IIC [Negativicutes bacterium]|nr:PTS sugar transporter subunit IIC [Negativicutes bacterium]